ncbi:hypothetical protein DFP72DRAFT_1083574 [Ephemerocybe angulata]|uniref:Uncharacterized protein n=1 Tax=Ephemerocybe angulata TaxID=980116 RepID=A0A8H6LS13_9AGAR|nr:hypothetical protein DFP72DRAFT_1083574 [Tulosesus angulatus]
MIVSRRRRPSRLPVVTVHGLHREVRSPFTTKKTSKLATADGDNKKREEVQITPPTSTRYTGISNTTMAMAILNSFVNDIFPVAPPSPYSALASFLHFPLFHHRHRPPSLTSLARRP